MKIEQYDNIAESLYMSALYMLDFDANGLVFSDIRLLPYLASTNDYILQKISEEEFSAVTDKFVEKWEEKYSQLEKYIQKLALDGEVGNYAKLERKQHRQEQKEIEKLIRWIKEEFTYDAVKSIEKVSETIK